MAQDRPALTIPIDVQAIQYIRAYCRRFPHCTLMDLRTYVGNEFDWVMHLDHVKMEMVVLLHPCNIGQC